MKNSIVTRGIGIFLLLGVLAYAILMGSHLSVFMDTASMVIVLFITYAMLMFSGTFTDYIRGIAIAMGKTEYILKEYRASSLAMALSIKLCFMSGFIGSIIGVVQMLRTLDDISYIGPFFAVAVLTVFYALCINLIQYAIKARIDKEIIYREN